MTQQTMNSTVTWCGTVRQFLTDVEKAILFHEHEAKCNWFYGKYDKVEYHKYMIEKIKQGSEQ